MPTVFGLAEHIARLVATLPERRFITIVGAGGIGKTTLALAAADALGEAYGDGICFVDLAPLGEARLLPEAISGALGLPALTRAADLLAHLRGLQMLLILDTCEHLLDAAAALVESLLADALKVNVIATSREPLRALGEWLHRLEPMALPPFTGGLAKGLTAQVALGYPAVRLFVARARAKRSGLRLTDAQAPRVVRLCARLDGIPLLIELAAERVAPTRPVAQRPLRHRSLQALLDWSHELLSPREQAVLRGLSALRGTYTLAAAAAWVGDETMSADEATEAVLALVAKSLLMPVFSEGASGLRMLGTTRAYAAARAQMRARFPDEPEP